MELGEVDGRRMNTGYGYLTQQKYYPAEAAYLRSDAAESDWKVGLSRCYKTNRYGDGLPLRHTS